MATRLAAALGLARRHGLRVDLPALRRRYREEETWEDSPGFADYVRYEVELAIHERRVMATPVPEHIARCPPEGTDLLAKYAAPLLVTDRRPLAVRRSSRARAPRSSSSSRATSCSSAAAAAADGAPASPPTRPRAAVLVDERGGVHALGIRCATRAEAERVLRSALARFPGARAWVTRGAHLTGIDTRARCRAAPDGRRTGFCLRCALDDGRGR